MSRLPTLLEAEDYCIREGENLAKLHSRPGARAVTYDELVAYAEKRASALLETVRPSVTPALYAKDFVALFLRGYKGMRDFIANQMKLF